MTPSPWAVLGLPQAPVPEAESADYGACRADLHGLRLVLRVAKTTPTKTGQFVTVWKRPHPAADIAPLDEADPVDVVIIAAADGAQHGLFIFPRSVLLERGVMSRAGAGIHPGAAHAAVAGAVVCGGGGAVAADPVAGASCLNVKFQANQPSWQPVCNYWIVSVWNLSIQSCNVMAASAVIF